MVCVEGGARLRFEFPGKFWEWRARLVLCGPFVGRAYIDTDPTPSRNDLRIKLKLPLPTPAGAWGLGRAAWHGRGGWGMGAGGRGRSNPRTLQNVHIPDKSDSLPVIRGEAWLVGFDHRTKPDKAGDT